MRTSAFVFLSAMMMGCSGATPIDVVIQPLDVDPGTEVQNCYYLKAPVDEPVDLGHIKIAFAPGTHHVHVYYGAEAHDDGVEECFNAVDFDKWHLLVAAQRDQLDWELPEGVAFRIEAQQQLLIQVHYVNAGPLTTTARRGGGTIELSRRPTGEVREHMGSIFGQQRDIHIAPNSSYSVEGLCKLPRELDLAAYAGHYHFRGTGFIGSKTDLTGVPAEEFYRSTDFAEPAFQIYGAADPEHFAVGEQIMWHCDYENPTGLEVDFGPREADQEHCNMFAFYHPALTEQEFVPCVSYQRCPAPCTDGQTCSMAGTCVDP